MSNMLKALTIAGSDSGGGAGIQADLKTFSALGCYGTSAITALTAQNTKGVNGIYGIDPAFIEKQIDAVLEDIGADAIKIGMLHSPEVIQTVTESLKKFDWGTMILDPVMVAKSGDRLLQEDAIESLKEQLLPQATLITPNLPEAEVLIGKEIKDFEAMKRHISELTKLGPEAVLLKGGHLAGDASPDLLYVKASGKMIEMAGEKIDTPNTHGTGCTLSSAIASFCARGFTLEEACRKAKRYMNEALKVGAQLKIGEGKGPVHHFHQWWD